MQLEQYVLLLYGGALSISIITLIYFQLFVDDADGSSAGEQHRRRRFGVLVLLRVGRGASVFQLRPGFLAQARFSEDDGTGFCGGCIATPSQGAT